MSARSIGNSITRSARKAIDWLDPFWVMVVIWFAVTLLIVFSVRWAPSVPKCPEDAIYVGGGDYRDGQWDYLHCWDAD